MPAIFDIYTDTVRKLIEFIRNIYVVVLFIILEVVAVNYYARSSSYAEARLLTRSNNVMGGFRGVFADIRHYFRLGSENRALTARVAELEEQLARYNEAATAMQLDSCMQQLGEAKYHYATAKVVSNSINRAKNFITLNRGRADGITEDMGILSPEGAMVGYIVDCTERYSVAISVLNTDFRASGRLEGSEYLGSIQWEGTDSEIVTMSELSKYAEPQEGQKVYTTGFSHYFPEGVLIGTVESAELTPDRTSYTVRVRLAARMSRQNNVVVVSNRDMWELRDLGQSEQIELHTRE